MKQSITDTTNFEFAIQNLTDILIDQEKFDYFK